ncbi:MAG: methyltransferase domain-containing protein [Alphaproteobacteria bacterium]|nr:methyltransferase domain-containing protein [Alphaproteobacteria bacterium]
MVATKDIAEPTLPMYVKKIYPMYTNKKLSKFFDREEGLSLFSFGNRQKLIKAVLREVEQSKDYLQIGITFGNQIEQTADKIGYYGNYHIVDISKTQVERLKEKYQGIQQNLNFSNQNGLAQIPNRYDGIICFMLLHELPPQTRQAMINHILESVREKCKVIFIDYHTPQNRFMKKLFKTFHRLYNPFAEDFVSKEIFDYAENKDQFFWNKSLYANGLYQKVVAIKKEKTRT